MLHIISKLDCISLALDYAAPQDEFLLVQEAVYAINPGHYAHAQLNLAATKALHADVEARGLLSKRDQSIGLVDFGGYVDLTAEHRKSISW